MASPVLGLDLGTTNSVVAVSDGARVRVLSDDEGTELTPSAVSFHPSGEVLVGKAARERRLVDAQNTVFSVKRLIGRPFRSAEVRRAAERLPFALVEGANGGVMVETRGETYSLPEISAFVLRRMRAVAEAALGQSCVNAVVTVPANFNELQRTATRDAGRISGLNILRILNEPTAAALAYGFDAKSRERVAVYDLGGGTFDISILDLSGDVIEVIATAGDTYLGGDDIDVAIADRMVTRFLESEQVDLGSDAQAYERLRLAAEWIKCRLSELDRAQVTVQEMAHGRGGKPVDLRFELDRSELDRLVFPLVGRTFDICEEAMRIAGVRPAQLDKVILVGGQTRSPQVQRMVAEYFGREPLTSVDPDQVVAQGAALQAYALSGAKSPAKGRWKTSLSSPPPPMPVAPAPASNKKAEQAFDEEPTKVLSRPLPPPPPVPGRAEDDFGELLTTVHTRSSAPPSGQTPKDKSTLVGVGAPDGKKVKQYAASGQAAPKPPPLDQILRRPSAAVPPPLPAKRSSAPVPPPSSLPVESAPVARVELQQKAIDDRGQLVEPTAASLRAAPVPDVALPELPSITDGSGALEMPDGLDVPISEPPPSVTPPAYEPSAITPPPTAESISPTVISELPHAPHQAPLLLDVTPHTLGVETAGGYCEEVIERNAPIPTEQTRIFTTSQDDQMAVSVRVCQGEQRRMEDNEVLGSLELLGLRQAARGEVKIGVTFVLDADGTLSVRARDQGTGKSQQIRINLVGALSDGEVKRMRQRQQRMTGN